MDGEATLVTTNRTDLRRRVENVQVAVAVGIISAYIAALNRDVPHIDTRSQIPTAIAGLSLFFLLTKSAVISMRPVLLRNGENEDSGIHIFSAKIDEELLPILYGALMFGVVVVGVLAILPPVVDFLTIITHSITAVNGLLRHLSVRLSSVERFIGFALLAIITGLLYGQRYSDNMSTINTSAPSRTVPYTGGPEGGEFHLQINNPLKEFINKEDISIVILPPEDVDISVRYAEQVAKNVWQPRIGIEPQGQIELTIEISGEGAKDELSEDVIEILTRSGGEVQQRHEITVEG